MATIRKRKGKWFVEIRKKYFKPIRKINFKNRRSGDMVKVIANTKKLKKILNWKPKYYNLNKIVKSSINWEKIIK